ncbi:hypothetical protein DCO48_01620 [Pseudomonas sp. SDI]|uniref:hypothetical protein n=1 Tax=Pseudomonas sp. SDI TaxID=2170734 RepID=UPI000DE71C75|nr:hypothetical protein [Pseudomonas sp. SDI]PWB35613.1 hypothetical protein DCO48_01620 [Pseudomonas sp. SDI]
MLGVVERSWKQAPPPPVYYQPYPVVERYVPVPPPYYRHYYGPPRGYYGPPRWWNASNTAPCTPDLRPVFTVRCSAHLPLPRRVDGVFYGRRKARDVHLRLMIRHRQCYMKR